jgi:hypothetical protein
VRGRNIVVSADRVKPAHLLRHNQQDNSSPPLQSNDTSVPPAATPPDRCKTTRSGWTVRFPVRFLT